MISLETQARNTDQKLEDIRKSGLMPAVFYGKKQVSTPVSVRLQDFIRVWNEAGETSVITLTTPEHGELEALIHDIDFDPVKEVPRHADFYVFEKGRRVKIEVPLEFVGTAPSVKDLGGILIKVLHEVQVEAMPKDLPKELKVDISKLVNFDSQIVIADIVMPEGVKMLDGQDEVVALVSEPKDEVVEDSTPVDLSSIEVEKKGKKDEEGDGEEGVKTGSKPEADSKK